MLGRVMLDGMWLRNGKDSDANWLTLCVIEGVTSTSARTSNPWNHLQQVRFNNNTARCLCVRSIVMPKDRQYKHSAHSCVRALKILQRKCQRASDNVPADVALEEGRDDVRKAPEPTRTE
jgi:hypothetical protein